jgi:hypothetical protein
MSGAISEAPRKQYAALIRADRARIEEIRVLQCVFARSGVWASCMRTDLNRFGKAETIDRPIPKSDGPL